MNRAVNVSADTNAVTALCKSKSLAISTLEALPQGGSRVVFVTMVAADAFRGHMSGKLLTGREPRSGLYMARPPRAPHR